MACDGTDFIINAGDKVDSRQGSRRFVAILSKPLRAAEQEVRNIAGPLIALGVVIAILYFGRVFFITSLAAVMLAFILEPFVTLLVRIRFPRSLASFVVCAAALSMLYLMGMGAYSQLSGLAEELPGTASASASWWRTCRKRWKAWSSAATSW
jgi:predicted PurR-regulated permease PerM